MTQLVIPAQITRKVHAGLTERFETQLRKLREGKPVDVTDVVELSRMLKQQHELFSHREALVRMIHDEQDPETGLIKNRPEWLCWPAALAVRTSDLRALGATLKYPVPKLEAFTDTDALMEWVRGRNWDHPWGGPTGAGHMVAGALFAMSDLGILKQGALDRVFDCLDRLRDDTWGVWAKGHFDESNPQWPQLGGAFYFGMIYDRFRRSLPRPEGACRMLIEMQNRTGNGSFCTQESRSWPFASTDHDALYVLTRYSRLSAELRREVMPAVERYARYFVEQMTEPETFLIDYPIPKILAILRPMLPDPDDDVPHWDYEMYCWVL